MNEPPAELIKWLREERDRAFLETAYGSVMINAWRSAAIEGSEILQSTGDPTSEMSQQAKKFASKFYDANFSQNTEIPYYFGYLEQSQLLVERAAESITKNTIPRVVVTTRPTNHRYAAVYRPHICPSWSVIIVDFGFISAVIGFSVVLSRFIHLVEGQGGLAFQLPKGNFKSLLDKDHRTRSDVIRFLLPCLNLSSKDAPIPLPLDNHDDRRNIAAVVFLRSIFFIVVAHEYSHVLLGHRRLHSTTKDALHRMEYEADSLAIKLAINNPWKYFDYFAGGETATVMQLTSIHMQALMISMLGIIGKAEDLACELGHNISRDDTHPTSVDRLRSSQATLDSLALTPIALRSHIYETRQRMFEFTEELWAAVRKEMLEEIKNRSFETCPRVEVLNADLRFA